MQNIEPYRPYIDLAVAEKLANGLFSNEDLELSSNIKKCLLTVLECDCHFEREKSPMLVALTRTAASLVACFEGKKKKILYPKIYESKCP
jgi:CRISPR-associated protein Cas1